MTLKLVGLATSLLTISPVCFASDFLDDFVLELQYETKSTAEKPAEKFEFVARMIITKELEEATRGLTLECATEDGFSEEFLWLSFDDGPLQMDIRFENSTQGHFFNFFSLSDMSVSSKLTSPALKAVSSYNLNIFSSKTAIGGYDKNLLRDAPVFDYPLYKDDRYGWELTKNWSTAGGLTCTWYGEH